MRFLFLSASKSESTGPLQTSSGSRLGEVSEGTVDGCGWLMLCFPVQRQERTWRQSAESHREPELSTKVKAHERAKKHEQAEGWTRHD